MLRFKNPPNRLDEGLCIPDRRMRAEHLRITGPPEVHCEQIDKVHDGQDLIVKIRIRGDPTSRDADGEIGDRRAPANRADKVLESVRRAVRRGPSKPRSAWNILCARTSSLGGIGVVAQEIKPNDLESISVTSEIRFEYPAHKLVPRVCLLDKVGAVVVQ
jgi:hypothetical protein